MLAILFFTLLLLTSCATLLEEKTYDLDITTNLSHAKVKVYDSIYKLPNKVNVRRSNEDLELTLISDSLFLDYKVRSSLNPTFLYLNMAGLQFAPLGYAVDFTNKKRFYYGESIHLDFKDTLRVVKSPSFGRLWSDFFSETNPKAKGNVNFLFSIVRANRFSLKPIDFGKKVKTSFFGWGILTGLEYFYRDGVYKFKNR